MQLNVITDAATECARGVINYLKSHCSMLFPLASVSHRPQWTTACCRQFTCGPDSVMHSADCLLLAVGIVRTGRWNGKCSAQSPALVAAPNSPRHKTAFFDLRPCRHVFGAVAVRAEMRPFRTTEFFVDGLRFHEKLQFLDLTTLYSGMTSTSHPFDIGIPVPSVLPPMSLQVGGP